LDSDEVIDAIFMCMCVQLEHLVGSD
jgi:hypothetical protein